MPAKICLIGRTFGRLKVVSNADPIRIETPTRKNGISIRRVVCVCECGNKIVAQCRHLTGGHKNSCGCLRKECYKTACLTHGHTKSKNISGTYHSWTSMITRCTNPNRADYHRYGGRGISICARWRTFENFLLDMGERPEKATLGRINNNGNYEPGNCRWETRMEQMKNTVRTRRFTVNGITAHAAQLARIFNINVGTALRRIYHKGWSANDAFTKPAH